VLDEIDRLLNVLGKYATFNDKVKQDESFIPAVQLLEKIVAIRGKYNNLDEMQVIAASATVGRPLRRELSKLLDPQSKYKEGFPVIRPSDSQSISQSRSVSIPAKIKHVVVVFSDDGYSNSNPAILSDETLSQKVALIKQFWLHDYKQSARGIIFVPNVADAKQITGMMKFWDIKGIKSLYDSSDVVERMGMTSSKIVDRELYVAAVSGSRGLHIKDIDCVFVLNLPSTMDEYLHMAGRTGRFGNKRLDGTVVTVVNLDELKRIQSWQVALGIEIDVKYR
jgi:superfamily II DNA/RNA helicase